VSQCATPIKGTHIRVVKLDACGNPVTGTGSMSIVTKGFVQIQAEPQYEDGTEFFERTADGSVCVNQKDDPVLKRFQLTIDFCEVNTTLLAYMAGARELTANAAGATGFGFAISEGVHSNRFGLEVWQQVAGSGACDPTGAQRYIYNAFTNCGAAKLGSYTIENGRSTFQVICETRAPSAAATIGWLDGPGSGTSYLPTGETAGATEHWLWNVTTSAPPAPGCNPVTLT
jgi:hypothetical protein